MFGDKTPKAGLKQQRQEQAQSLRAIPLKVALPRCGAQSDRNNKRKWLAPTGVLSVNGAKFMNWNCLWCARLFLANSVSARRVSKELPKCPKPFRIEYRFENPVTVKRLCNFIWRNGINQHGGKPLGLRQGMGFVSDQLRPAPFQPARLAAGAWWRTSITPVRSTPPWAMRV